MDPDDVTPAEGKTPIEEIHGRLVRIHYKLGCLDEIVAYVNGLTDDPAEEHQ